MKRFVILIVAVLAVCVLWMAGWFYIAGQIESEIRVLAEADGVTQPRVECEKLAVGGAPFSFSPHCDNATITMADTTVSIARLSGIALFYSPNRIQLFATGPARITDAFTGASQEVRWSNLHASLHLNDGAVARFSAVVDDAVYADMLMGEQILASASHGEIHLVDGTPEDAQDGTGRTCGAYIKFDDVESGQLDFADGTVILDAVMSGLPDPALWQDPMLPAYIEALDGQLEIREISVNGDGISLNATGLANLTDTGLIEGRMEIASQGMADRVADLVGDPSLAQIIFGSPDDTGVARQNLAINQGTVIVGIIPVASLPPLF